MNLFYALLFCFMSCLCGSEAMPWSSICCLKKQNPFKDLHVKNIVDCKVQREGLCPFDAIIIKTLKGRTLCYDPKADWVTKHVVMQENDSCDIPNKKKAGGRRNKRKHKQRKRN